MESTDYIANVTDRLDKFVRGLTVYCRSAARTAKHLLYCLLKCPYSVPAWILNLACAHYFAVLGDRYYFRQVRSGELSDIETSITYFCRAISRIPPGRWDRGGSLDQLGRLYLQRWERTGRDQDLKTAYSLHNRAAELLFHDKRIAPRVIDHLGIVCRVMFRHWGMTNYIDEAIYYQNQALSLSSTGHSYHIYILGNLGDSHLQRFEAFQQKTDIEKALEYFERVDVPKTNFDPVDLAILKNSLGRGWVAHFDRFGDVPKLQQAIELHQCAVSSIPTNHPNKSYFLNDLGIAYRLRFERLEGLSDIEQSISCYKSAISLSPQGNHLRPEYISNLGLTLTRRFERLGSLSNIDDAVSHHLEAMSLTPDDNAFKYRLLDRLGYACAVRYQRLGEVSDLDQSIDFHRRAVLPLTDTHALKHLYLDHLGSAYIRRFQHFGNLSDLNKAITCYSQAVQLITDEHSHYYLYAGHLGDAYGLRFKQSKDRTDIDQAIKIQTQAVSLAGKDHDWRAMILENLGMAHVILFETYSKLENLQEAISCFQHAVSSVDDDHTLKPTLLYRLGVSQLAQYEFINKLPDQSSQSSGTISVDETPGVPTSDGDEWPVSLFTILTLPYNCGSQSSAKLDMVHQSMEYIQSAAQHPLGRPSSLFQAAQTWARLAVRYGVSSPLDAYKRVMVLLPQIVWMGATVQRRYKDVSHIGDTILEATAVAIDHQEYQLALEWLEQGRSVVWNQILQLRTPLDELRAVDEDLANKMQQVARSLELLGQSASTADAFRPEQDAQRLRRLAADWEQLLMQVRSLNGFENFLKPKNFAALADSAQSHPIVVVNIHTHRCDALVLLPGSKSVALVRLPEFSYTKAVDMRRKMISSLHGLGIRSAGNTTRAIVYNPEAIHKVDYFQEILSGLWDSVVEPILISPEYSAWSQCDANPTRITWCTTGPLTFLPLHAAAKYDELGRITYDHLVSSYTPTLSALLSDRSDLDAFGGILAVGFSGGTGSERRLSNVGAEIGAIEQQASHVRFKKLEEASATTSNTLKAMEEFSWVHFACHASQDITAPSLSGFRLYDDTLSLATITKKSLGRKGLAFLSACETARGSEKIPEEAVHLAAGMMVAGYPSVIATMWSIEDRDAPLISELVYTYLLADAKPNERDAAVALHQAVKQLRSQAGDKRYARWVPFIHVGK